MNLTPEQQVDLQAFCDKYKGHLTGTFTPDPSVEAFDLAVQVAPTPASVEPTPAPQPPVA